MKNPKPGENSSIIVHALFVFLVLFFDLTDRLLDRIIAHLLQHQFLLRKVVINVLWNVVR